MMNALHPLLTQTQQNNKAYGYKETNNAQQQFVNKWGSNKHD